MNNDKFKSNIAKINNLPLLSVLQAVYLNYIIQAKITTHDTLCL